MAMSLYASSPIDSDFFVLLKRQYGQFITSGAQLLLLLIGARFQSHKAWLWCLALMALISLFAWLSALYRFRTIKDTPTSRIASAAQGYVELIGTGKNLEDTPIISTLSYLPCLWYRYTVEQKNAKNEWTTHSSGESESPFLLYDGSATCVVDPTGAEIITTNKDEWTKGDFRYTEWKLLNIDAIYAIGEFKTFGGSTSTSQTSDEIKAVLAEWKENMPNLLARFDLDKNGTLDMQEWALARSAARREAEKRVAQARAEPDTNYLVRPDNGRLFLLSNLPPDKLARRYFLWTWAHLVILFGALGGIAFVLK
jgi:hypothetical protein